MTAYSRALESLYRLAGAVTPYTAWRLLEGIRRAGALSADELAAIQWRRLSACISHAYDNVTVYRDLWGRSGAHPGDIKGPDDFGRLPVLTRADIDSRPESDLLSKTADPRRLVSVCSSGTTTGRPLRVLIDNACYNHQYANLLYGYYLSGWRLGTPMMTLRNYAHGDYRGAYTPGACTPEPFPWLRSLVYRFVHRKRLLPPMQGGMRPDEAHMGDVLRRVRAYAPYLLEGNGYFWYQFARFALERGEELPSVKGVEVDEICLSPGQKETIARCFKCPVYDCYGSHELGVVAHGCPAQEGNHVLSLSHYVEIIDEQTGEKALPGRTGSVIITDMTNRAMPLIRYETGDLASMPAQPCACGSAYPLMSSVAGRRINRIASGGGLFTEAFFLDCILGHDGAVAFQIDNSRPDAPAVSLIARDPGLRDTVENDLRQATGMPVQVRLVDDIPLDPPGKGKWVRA